MECKIRKRPVVCRSVLQQDSGETEQTSKAGAWGDECLVGGTKEYFAGGGSSWCTTGSSTSGWCYVRWRGIEVDWDRRHRAARGWDHDRAGRDLNSASWDLGGAGWDLNGAGWDFDGAGGDLNGGGWDLYNAGNLDGDDRGSGADDWNATSVDDFIAGIWQGNGACVWNRRAAGDSGDGGNWRGVDNRGRDVCRREAIFFN